MASNVRTPNIPWKRKGCSLLTQLLQSAKERTGPLEFGIFKILFIDEAK